jgi:hypothetical protein
MMLNCPASYSAIAFDWDHPKSGSPLAVPISGFACSDLRVMQWIY